MIGNFRKRDPWRRRRHWRTLTNRVRMRAGPWLWPVVAVAALVLLVQAVRGPPDWLRLPLQAAFSAVMPAVVEPLSPATTGVLSGWAKVIDGDTLALAGRHIRLQGIDAPEFDQVCQDRRGLPWACGKQAAAALRGQIGWSPVRCDSLGLDRYNRVLARCYRGETDLNRWMVRQGWAVAYRHYDATYIADEAAARQAGDGVWQGPFLMPWDWRRDNDARGRRAQSR